MVVTTELLNGVAELFRATFFVKQRLLKERKNEKKRKD